MQTDAKIDMKTAIGFPGLVARALILIGGLNLNGVALMMSGHGQLFSPLLLAGSLCLVLISGRAAWRHPLTVLLSVFALLYTGVGALTSVEPLAALSQAVTYASSVLIVLALAAHVSCLDDPDAERLLRFTKYVLLAASASVLVSTRLAAFYALQLSSVDRNGGFFGNANEAGIVAATALAMTLTAPSKRPWVNLLHAALAAGAVFMTFSKSGIIVSFLVVAIAAVRSRSGVKLLLASGAMAATWLALGFLSAQDGLQITGSQKERLGQVLQILSGDVNSRTTTGRTELWSIAADRIEQNPFFGDGLGSFHHMVGGIMNEGVWMGAHNTYLMVWGEAGLLPLFALVGAVCLLLMAVCRRGFHPYGILYFTILQFDMMAAHNVLALRFHNVLLGIVLGLAIHATDRARSARPHR